MGLKGSCSGTWTRTRRGILNKWADAASASAHRSLAQQIEYWAALGRGLADPQSMYLFPVAVARKTKVRTFK